MQDVGPLLSPARTIFYSPGHHDIQTFSLMISLWRRSCQQSERRLWPTRQIILNWEMIQSCESLNSFAYFYWTWTHKLNPVHKEMQKGARTWLQDIFRNQNSILLIFFNSLTTSGMFFSCLMDFREMANSQKGNTCWGIIYKVINGFP